MTLFSLSFIYFSFYTIAVVFAFFRARAGTAPKARNSLAAMIIGAVGTLLIYVSSLFSPDGTVPLVLVAALALFPVFLLGLGNLVGLAIATWRPQVFVQAGLASLAFGVPLLAIALASMDSGSGQTGTGSSGATLTVEGRLGRYPISIPTSPQIDTRYTCFADTGSTLGQCQTGFADGNPLRDVPGNVPIFHQITVARKSTECTAPCITFRQLAQWCQSRSDLAFAEWCQNEPADEVTFSYDENPSVSDDPAEGWRAIDGDFGTASVACRKEDVLTLCRARYDIARNLQVTIAMTDVAQDAVGARVEIAQDYVARLWATMQIAN